MLTQIDIKAARKIARLPTFMSRLEATNEYLAQRSYGEQEVFSPYDFYGAVNDALRRRR